MTTINYDICNLTGIVITSTYLKFGEICDILGYHKFSKAWFYTDYLNVSVLRHQVEIMIFFKISNFSKLTRFY